MLAYRREVDAAPLRIDRADVRQTDDELTLILSAGGLHVMLIRLRYNGWVDEVINSAGVVASGPAAWTLIDRDVALELDARAAAALGFSRDCRLRLDVDDNTIRMSVPPFWRSFNARASSSTPRKAASPPDLVD